MELKLQIEQKQKRSKSLPDIINFGFSAKISNLVNFD